AVDADGDGRRDVVDNPADLIASTANNLKKDGWQPGQSWGYEVVVPQGFNYMLADRAKTMTLAQWEQLGLKPATGQPFVQPWPRQERELSRSERLELQQLLVQRGFYRGTPDGQLGGLTREALRSFQASIGAAADGFASSDVLERLRGH